MGISPTQLLIILVIVVLIFGTKKLRNMGGDLGSAFKNFKKAMNDDDKDTQTPSVEEDPAKKIDHQADADFTDASLKDAPPKEEKSQDK